MGVCGATRARVGSRLGPGRVPPTGGGVPIRRVCPSGTAKGALPLGFVADFRRVEAGCLRPRQAGGLGVIKPHESFFSPF